MATLIAACNAQLDGQDVPGRITASFRHTGNFIVECPADGVEATLAQIQEVVAQECVILRAHVVAKLVGDLR